MGLLDRFGLLNRNSVTPTTTNSAVDTQGLAQTLRSAGFNITVNGRPVDKELTSDQIEELYTGIAHAAIQLTSVKVAQAIEDHLAVIDPKNKKEKLEESHPYDAAITAAPMSDTFFWRAITEYVLAMGNAYIYKGETELTDSTFKTPVKFELLESHHVSYIKDRRTKKLVGYKYDKDGSDLKGDHLKNNVIHVHDLNIFDLDKGKGMLNSIVRNLLIEDQSTLLQLASLQNGTSIPGIITVDPETPKDIFENIKESVERRWSGVKTDKAGAPVVMKGGKIDYQSVGVEYDKLAMDKLRDSNDNVLRSRLGVSKTILGQEESGVTRDTSETMTENFEDNTVIPLARMIVDAFSQDYINIYPSDYARKPREYAVIKPERKKAEDELTEAEAFGELAKAVAALVNAGFDPKKSLEVAGIDDIPYIGKPTAPVTTPTNGIEKTKEASEVPKDDTSSNQRLHDVENSAILNSFIDDYGCHTNAFDPASMTADQKELASSIARIDESLLPLYLASLDKDIPAKERKEIQQELQNLIYGYASSTTASIAPARYAELVQRHGGEGNFRMTQATFNELVEQASKASLSHLDTIDQNVKSIVAQVLKDELGEKVAAQKVEEYFKQQLTEYESQRLAVDQSRRIFGEAKLLSDKQFLSNNNLTAYKVLRNYGPSPCPYCQASAGKRVPVDSNFWDLNDVITAHDNEGNVKAFKVGYAPVTSGKIHPFCGCDYELIIEE